MNPTRLVRVLQVFGLIAIGFLFVSVSAQNLGKIDFPTSASGDAQKHFIEGVLYLHNFEFDDAAEEFQAAQRISPGFAMAYWGEAMTDNHPLWRQVDVQAGQSTLKRLAPSLEERLARAPTDREKDFLRAVEALYFTEGDKATRDLAYSEAMGEMYRKYPDDLEVASFYALSILGLTDGVRDFRNYMRAASIVEEVFAKNPLHPGAAHYLIHSYDDPIHAPLGLRAARVYARIAPAASHAQHMVSHIYVALGQWDQAVTANETAWAVSKARVERKKLSVGQADFHALFWLHYSYLQQGRYEEAREMLKVVQDAVRSQEQEADHAHHGMGRIGSYDGQMKVQQLVEDPTGSIDLQPSKGRFPDLFAEALLALRAGESDRVRSLLAGMKPGDPADTILKMEVEALLKRHHGDLQGAISLMREAAAMEDQMPLSYGPPEPSKPSHELLGELLLESGAARESVEEFQKSLERAPRRALSLLGLTRAARQAGDQETAAEAMATLRDVWHLADPAVLVLIEK